MDDLKISLIVPAYNVERYVGECLQSICSQTWQNWEAVVIDDGSSDGTGRICDLWQEFDHRVHVYHIANGGVSAARNAALKLVTGEIVGFADADDRLPHTAFERIAGHFMQSPSLSAVFAGHRRMDESGRITETRQGKPFAGADGRAAAGMTLEQGRDSYLGVLWNKYFRRDCLIRDGQPAVFSTDYRIGEDQVWLLEVCRGLQSVEAETEPVYDYRIRGGSAVHADISAEARRSEILARREMVELTRRYYPEYTAAAALKYRTCMHAAARTELRRMKPGAAVRAARGYYKDAMAGQLSRKRRVKETLFQCLYGLLSPGEKE
ncbi:MAG: glycosyltransferase [Lachnospiraceae bacterium]|nr:glycosyltransferase [Lachnospiraceae bacterium]